MGLEEGDQCWWITFVFRLLCVCVAGGGWASPTGFYDGIVFAFTTATSNTEREGKERKPSVRPTPPVSVFQKLRAALPCFLMESSPPLLPQLEANCHHELERVQALFDGRRTFFSLLFFFSCCDVVVTVAVDHQLKSNSLDDASCGPFRTPPSLAHFIEFSPVIAHIRSGRTRSSKRCCK